MYRSVSARSGNIDLRFERVQHAAAVSLPRTMNADKLIHAVYKRPELWDPKHIGHNNRMLVNKLWQEVAEEVGTDSKFLQNGRHFGRLCFALEMFYGEYGISFGFISRNQFAVALHLVGLKTDRFSEWRFENFQPEVTFSNGNNHESP